MPADVRDLLITFIYSQADWHTNEASRDREDAFSHLRSSAMLQALAAYVAHLPEDDYRLILLAGFNPLQEKQFLDVPYDSDAWNMTVSFGFSPTDPHPDFDAWVTAFVNAYGDQPEGH